MMRSRKPRLSNEVRRYHFTNKHRMIEKARRELPYDAPGGPTGQVKKCERTLWGRQLFSLARWRPCLYIHGCTGEAKVRGILLEGVVVTLIIAGDVKNVQKSTI